MGQHCPLHTGCMSSLLHWWYGSGRTVSMSTCRRLLHHPSPWWFSHSPFSQGLFSLSVFVFLLSACLLPQHLPWLLSQTPASLRATGLCELLPFFVCFLCKGLKLLFVLHSSLWVGSTPQPAVVRWIILLLSKSKGRVSFCLNLPNVLSGFSLHPCPRYFHVLEITSEIRGYLTLSNCSICPIQRMSAKYLCH